MISFFFQKMHGAGNDFIMVDNRAMSFPSEDAAWLARICDRHHGIGADGIVLIEPSAQCDFAMRFFNPDGHPASLCGNGARCVARLAHDLKIASDSMTFQTAAGIVHARLQNDGVCTELPPPHGLETNIALRDNGITVDVINTGVPHAVVFTTQLDLVDMSLIGKMIRRHPRFSPEGVNANMVELLPDRRLAVRTYERGVESETLACGTGITASALIAHLKHALPSPIQVLCRHGDTMTVHFSRNPDGSFASVSLTGPVEYVFTGSIPYP